MPCAPILGNREHYHPNQGSFCLDCGRQWGGVREVRGEWKGKDRWEWSRTMNNLFKELKDHRMKVTKGGSEKMGGKKGKRKREKDSGAVVYMACWASTAEQTGHQQYTLTSTTATHGCIPYAPEGLSLTDSPPPPSLPEPVNITSL